MADDQVQKINNLLKDFKTAMLITNGDDAPHHARPMAIAHVDENCDIWFFTGRRAPKVEEIRNDQRVLVVCQDERTRYVSLRGRALLLDDASKATELWSDSFKGWFPGGPTDPDLLLILVRAEEAEYWDTHGSKGLRYLFEALKARVTDTRPKIQEGEQHGRARMR